MELINQMIRLNAAFKEKAEAIKAVADLLIEAGKVTPDYLEGMLEREKQENTYLGNGIAIPHGTLTSRHAIRETAIAVVQVPGGVDWGEGEKAYLIVGIAAGDQEHLSVLKRLAHVVGDEEVAQRLAQTTDIEEIRWALSSVADIERDAENDQASQKQYIVGITSCPTGVAHTYMAQEALEQAAKRLGKSIKIETQGSVGVNNALSNEDIRRADVVIIAADTNVDKARFHGKKLYETGTKAAINDGERVIEEALTQGKIYTGDADLTKSMNTGSEIGGLYKHLMTGVSYMLPFVVAGGLLIALGFAVGSFFFGDQGIFIYEDRYRDTLAATLFLIGKDAFALFVPVLGGYIAYSIAGRVGIAPGMIGAYIASNTGAGFIGAIIAGFVAGYSVRWLNRLIKLPPALESLKPTLILPLLGTTFIGLLMYLLIAHPVANVLSALTAWLKSMESVSSLVLGAILGGMMGLDMGGPVNKAAYTFSTSLLGSDIYAPMAATMAAGMTPPLAIFLATVFFKNQFTDEERQAGKAAAILGLSFITEGAIPFAARDPLRVIPAFVIGSAVAGALSMGFGCLLRAPHGGIFVLLIPNAVSHVGLYLVAILAGTLVSAILIGLMKKRLVADF